MIYISGIEDGSGDGTAAGRKAGWVSRGRATTLPPMRTSVSQPVKPAPARVSVPEWVPARPAVGPDGRPLPPDGSAPASRPRQNTGATGPVERLPALPVEPSTPAPARPAFDPNGRPVPPVGTAPPRRAQVPAQKAAGPTTSAKQTRPSLAARKPGTPLPPGESPTAPAGHTFTARPSPAPPGEFLFAVRCSCGLEASAPVTLAALKAGAERGLPAAAVIAIATQDALDAMHAG